MVSGDGSGMTQFWDGKQGTLLQAQKRHRADVLCLAAAPDGETVFSAGVDGQVSAGRDRWSEGWRDCFKSECGSPFLLGC